MPRSSLLFVCLLVSTAVAFGGEGECYIPGIPVPSWEYPGPPLAADCQAIVSRMPSLSPDADDSGDQNPNPTRYSSNSPFFPEATFLHKSCAARIACHRNLRPWRQIEGYSYLKVAQHQHPFTPNVALSASSILKLWTLVKGVAQRITDECPPIGRNGDGWAPINIPEAAAAWCSVHILGTNTRGWEHRARVEGARVIRGSSRSQRATGGGLQNKFRTTIAEVP